MDLHHQILIKDTDAVLEAIRQDITVVHEHHWTLFEGNRTWRYLDHELEAHQQPGRPDIAEWRLCLRAIRKCVNLTGLLTTINIHIVGDGKAGKSTAMGGIIQGLQNGGASWYYRFYSSNYIDIEHGRTRGVEMSHLIKYDEQEKRHIHYVIHDYGGQEEFHLLHADYLSKPNSIYIVIIPLFHILPKSTASDASEASKAGGILYSLEEMKSRYRYWLKFIYTLVTSPKKTSDLLRKTMNSSTRTALPIPIIPVINPFSQKLKPDDYKELETLPRTLFRCCTIEICQYKWFANNNQRRKQASQWDFIFPSISSTLLVVNSNSLSDVSHHYSTAIYALTKVTLMVGQAEGTRQSCSIVDHVRNGMAIGDCTLFQQDKQWKQFLATTITKHPEIASAIESLKKLLPDIYNTTENTTPKLVETMLIPVLVDYVHDVLQSMDRIWVLMEPLQGKYSIITNPSILTSVVIGDLFYWYFRNGPISKLIKANPAGNVLELNPSILAQKLCSAHDIFATYYHFHTSNIPCDCWVYQSTSKRLQLQQQRSGWLQGDSHPNQHNWMTAWDVLKSFEQNQEEQPSDNVASLLFNELNLHGNKADGIALMFELLQRLNLVTPINRAGVETSSIAVSSSSLIGLAESKPISAPIPYFLPFKHQPTTVIKRLFRLASPKQFFVPGYFTKLFIFLHGMYQSIATKIETWSNALNIILDGGYRGATTLQLGERRSFFEVIDPKEGGECKRVDGLSMQITIDCCSVPFTMVSDIYIGDKKSAEEQKEQFRQHGGQSHVCDGFLITISTWGACPSHIAYDDMNIIRQFIYEHLLETPTATGISGVALPLIEFAVNPVTTGICPNTGRIGNITNAASNNASTRLDEVEIMPIEMAEKLLIGCDPHRLSYLENQQASKIDTASSPVAPQKHSPLLNRFRIREWYFGKSYHTVVTSSSVQEVGLSDAFVDEYCPLSMTILTDPINQRLQSGGMKHSYAQRNDLWDVVEGMNSLEDVAAFYCTFCYQEARDELFVPQTDGDLDESSWDETDTILIDSMNRLQLWMLLRAWYVKKTRDFVLKSSKKRGRAPTRKIEGITLKQFDEMVGYKAPKLFSPLQDEQWKNHDDVMHSEYAGKLEASSIVDEDSKKSNSTGKISQQELYRQNGVYKAPLFIQCDELTFAEYMLKPENGNEDWETVDNTEKQPSGDDNSAEIQSKPFNIGGKNTNVFRIHYLCQVCGRWPKDCEGIVIPCLSPTMKAIAAAVGICGDILLMALNSYRLSSVRLVKDVLVDSFVLQKSKWTMDLLGKALDISSRQFTDSQVLMLQQSVFSKMSLLYQPIIMNTTSQSDGKAIKSQQEIVIREAIGHAQAISSAASVKENSIVDKADDDMNTSPIVDPVESNTKKQTYDKDLKPMTYCITMEYVGRMIQLYEEFKKSLGTEQFNLRCGLKSIRNKNGEVAWVCQTGKCADAFLNRDLNNNEDSGELKLRFEVQGL